MDRNGLAPEKARPAHYFVVPTDESRIPRLVQLKAIAEPCDCYGATGQSLINKYERARIFWRAVKRTEK